jgi:hypothetical protein
MDDYTEMTFLTSSLEGMMRWYVMIADHTEIISPRELKLRAFDFVKTIQKKINTK